MLKGLSLFSYGSVEVETVYLDPVVGGGGVRTAVSLTFVRCAIAVEAGMYPVRR